MKSYGQIKAILEAELNRAIEEHEDETTEPGRTGAAVEWARERYERFALHGMIPEDFSED